ncbi:Gamma-glutamyl cyclotransferase verK [Cladobotryum mycophilum]|uniref:gamma-glutamylcyclotransferase n=1 Tax=Cladobotryum mycophilum TaxID=491253 RepID=A0ABR0S7J7_9HYPO
MSTEKKMPIWKIAALSDKPLWYLGYGSNMKASSMKDRKVEPLATKIVNVPTHYVTFDIFGIPYSEPCYASLEEFPDGGNGKLQLVHGDYSVPVPSLCGIAHLLTPADFHRLLVTEGSGVVYDIVEVQAFELGESRIRFGASFPVYTLKAKWPQRPNGTPSARYVNLFLQGAKDNNLSPEYIEYLERFPRYHKIEGPERTLGQYVFDNGWRPFLKRLVRTTTWNVDEDGNCPIFVARTIVWLYQAMWTYHDCVHKHIFGEGDGGKLLWTEVKE